MDVDELVLMTNDMIEYDTLPDDVLEQLVFEADFFIATSSLSELSIRRSSKAAPVAWKVLSESYGDRFLQASALSALYNNDRTKAIDFISHRIQRLEPYLLNKVMELMVDNASDFETETEPSLIQLVAERLKGLEEKGGSLDLDEKAAFLQRFAHHL